ncbi:MAG: hypothetical protein II285_01865, partial [Flavobacteriales bacterium]|nr:hypothetical protein [Flavobacteriales bacterium]
MKKLLIMAMLLLGIVAQAQERETVYVTFTSKVSGETEGVIKSYPKQRETHLSEPMAFRVRSQLKNYMLTFLHINFDLDKLSQRLDKLSQIREVKWDDTVEIIYRPTSFLNEVTVIDLDTMLPFADEATAEAWADTMVDKKVYFIDKNDTVDNTLRLIQVT